MSAPRQACPTPPFTGTNSEIGIVVDITLDKPVVVESTFASLVVVVVAFTVVVDDSVDGTVLVPCDVVCGTDEEVGSVLSDGHTPEVWPMQASPSESFTDSCGQAPPPKSNE